MIFEGPEKKLEIVTEAPFPSLRTLEAGFWEDVVRRAQAEIISATSTDACDAYLLCESSLFVCDRRAVMITCGRTKLIESALALIDRIPAEQLASLIYERKNENFPELQHTTFDEDAGRLREKLPGRSVIFGNPTADHVALFHLDRDFDPDPTDATLEVLMYDIDSRTSRRFSKGASTLELRKAMGLGETRSGLVIDDHLFDPMGYSFNGVTGEYYTTLHVTPQKKGSYTSFETNQDLDGPALGTTVSRLLRFFAPRRADVLLFQKTLDLGVLPEDFRVVSAQSAGLSCGYTVEYAHLERGGVTVGGAAGPIGSTSRRPE
jgi:S-adenosylmethionine decarboxylase